MRFRAEHLRPHGWAPPQTLQIPDWCGCSTEYLPVPAGDGWWSLVPIWEPDQRPSPLGVIGCDEPDRRPARRKRDFLGCPSDFGPGADVRMI